MDDIVVALAIWSGRDEPDVATVAAFGFVDCAPSDDVAGSETLRVVDPPPYLLLLLVGAADRRSCRC